MLRPRLATTTILALVALLTANVIADLGVAQLMAAGRMIKDTGDLRPITQGPWFDYDRDVTEQAGLPSEEHCHNVATTGVDSGGLQGTGGHVRIAGT